MSRKTEQEMFPLIADWESGNQTRESFCQEKGVSLATFSYWRTRYRTMQSEAAGFTEIKPEVSSKLIIIYPNGVRIELHSISIATVEALVHLG